VLQFIQWQSQVINLFLTYHKFCTTNSLEIMTIEAIQNICKTLLGVIEDIKWQHSLCLNIADKMFLVVSIDNIPVTDPFKVKDDTFEETASREGFKPAPYLPRHKGVLVEDINLLSENEWQFYIKQSYQLIISKLSKKKLHHFGGDD
jgi:predicted DNA-binding protein (MmcQ/YjbR family)